MEQDGYVVGCGCFSTLAKMRILYVQPGLGIGGSKISLLHMLQSAPKGQISQVALTLPPRPEYEQMLSGYVEKIHYLDLPTWNKYRRHGLVEWFKASFSHLKRLLSLVPAVRKLVSIIKEEQIDLIHTNNSLCPAGAFSAYIAHIPHVWHVREPIGSTGQYPLIPGDWLSLHLFQWLSDVIICNSQYTANVFRQNGYSVEIIQNGLDLQIFQGAEARGFQLRRQLFGDTDYPLVAMVGNLTTQWKEHATFLEIAGKLSSFFPQCQFVVYGGNSNLYLTPYTRELRQIVKRLNIENRVVWADFIGDIPAIMHSMDILIHSASKEGSGRVVMEAMAAGKPVIGVRSGGVQELIQDGDTGFLVSPNDVNAFTEKVAFLLENPQARGKIGEQAANYAQKNFSNERMMKSIVEIYNESNLS